MAKLNRSEECDFRRRRIFWHLFVSSQLVIEPELHSAKAADKLEVLQSFLVLPGLMLPVGFKHCLRSLSTRDRLRLSSNSELTTRHIVEFSQKFVLEFVQSIIGLLLRLIDQLDLAAPFIPFVALLMAHCLLPGSFVIEFGLHLEFDLGIPSWVGLCRSQDALPDGLSLRKIDLVLRL